ncbi:TatD family hydrolase [archaeon]|jgi:TatD DNase family protein|nr:TatD family hydrolase [archaeon]
MNLIDVHAHLDHERFEKDLDLVIARFKEAGGEFIFSSGVDAATNRIVLDLSKKYDCVKASFGLYPLDALERETGNIDFDVDEELSWIEEHKDDCVCIGEIGMDFNESKEKALEQEQVFRKVLELAKKIDKTVVIHSRKAELEVIDIMEDEGMENVVMHCFCGKKSLIKRCVENGWSFSVPAVIKRWQNFQMLVEIVPLEQLVTETDAPLLSPVIGERNEPSNVTITIGEIAKIKGMDETGVAEQIFKNAKELFDL